LDIGDNITVTSTWDRIQGDRRKNQYSQNGIQREKTLSHLSSKWKNISISCFSMFAVISGGAAAGEEHSFAPLDPIPCPTQRALFQ
jgi:hypothetical protein